MVLSLAILLCLVGLSFVSAAETAANITAVSGGSAINSTIFSITKNVNTLINISINITESLGSNITAVIITLPVTGFLSDVSSAGFSDMNTTATSPLRGGGINYTLNASTRIINWTSNLTNNFLFNATSGRKHYFWFNVIANMSYRSSQNLTVTLYNSTVGTYYNFSFVINVNDTFAIPFSSKTNTTGTNLSANYLYYQINFSHLALNNGSDVTMNVSVYNSTSLVNYTYIQTNNSAGSLFIFNLSGLINGRYNINITVNNTYGEYNTSSRRIILDTTGPALTFSCTVYTILSGNTMSCSCSAIDVLDAAAVALYNSAPLTNNIGNNLPVGCGSIDSAGNYNSSTLYYNVTLTGTASGGGSGPSGTTTTVTWSQTFVATDKELSEKGAVTYDLGSKNRMKVKVNAEEHYIGVVSVTATSATIQVSSTTQEVTMSVGDVKKFDVNNDSYYDLSVSLESITSGKAKVTATQIREAVVIAGEEPGAGAGAGEGTGSGETAAPSKTTKAIIWMVVIALVIAAAVLVVVFKKKIFKKKRW